MAEILVIAQADTTAPASPFKWLAGHCVVVMPDGWEWGAEEALPKFFVLKFPNVPINRVIQFLSQFTDQELTQTDPGDPQRRRVWQIQQLPLAARNKIKAQGFLTILVSVFGYTGTYDYTWAQVKNYWLNTVSGTTYIADIT